MTKPRSSHGSTRTLARQGRIFLLAVFVLGLLQLSGRGDVVILKDGYAIHGKLFNEQTAFVDKLTGDQIVTAKMGGLSLVDDGPRFTAFSAHYKRVGDVDPQNKYADAVRLQLPAKPKTSYALPSPLVEQSKGEFNALWRRTRKFENPFQPQNPHVIEEQVDILTPHYVRIRSVSHVWATYYLTSELGSELVIRLLKTHPDLIEKTGQPDGGRRAKIIRFLIQADWLNEAEAEIDSLLAVLPAESKRADEFRDMIRDIRLDKAITDIERAKEFGQHDFARRALARFPKDKLSAKISLKIASLKAEYDASSAKLEKAVRYLKELQELANEKKFKDLIQAADFIISELHLDAIARLDLFITLAGQAEQARKDQQTPLHAPEELLSAAVCGWLMGNAATETSVVTARKRLRARGMALNYLRESSPLQRHEAITTYVADKESLPFDELERLISLLPPPEAEKDRSSSPQEKKTGPLPGLQSGAHYLLKLPPEYQHSRAYPLLMILPEGGERPAAVLARFGDLPARYGFIVAVLDWAAGFKGNYNYTDEEQLLVIGTLRHLQRTLQVDSDKVFLFGDGDGANFALDLGATHPDLFAGIVPMTPSPNYELYKVFHYWKNFQNLPVYMIVGDRAGASVKTIRDILTEWMPRGYPCLAVSYKGRGFEWFGEELPFVFDWMSRKTRATAFPDLGGGNQEYRTVRTNSNRFYWIGIDEIEPSRLYDPERRNTRIFPATVKAHFVEGNRINVEAMGMRQLSIWLGRGTVDFTKPIYVDLKGFPQGTWKKELTPQVSVLLEDLYERGDRQRPVYQRIDCKELNKLVKFSAQ